MCPPRPASIIGGTKHSSTLIGPIRSISIVRRQWSMFELLDFAPGRDPGDVHDDVHAGRDRVHFRGEGDHRLVVGDVGRREVRDDPSRVADLGDDPLEALAVAVGEEELGALAGGGDRRRPADPAGRAGDQAALAPPGSRSRRLIGGLEVGLDFERVEGHRQHLVVADQHAELDQQDLVEVAAQLRPELGADLAPLVHLVGGAEQQRPALRPARRVGAGPHSRDLLFAEPDAPGHPLVLAPLVLAAGVVGDAQDDQLGLLARQLAAWHQRPGEPEPAPEEAAVAPQRGEDVRRLTAGADPAIRAIPAVEPAELARLPGTMRGPSRSAIGLGPYPNPRPTGLKRVHMSRLRPVGP